MKIPTNSFCPTCNTRLSRDLEAQVLVCEKGHQFAEGQELPQAQAPATATPQPHERKKGTTSKLVGRPLDDDGAVELHVERAPAPPATATEAKPQESADWPEEAPEPATLASEAKLEEKAAPEPSAAQEPTIQRVEPPPVPRQATETELNLAAEIAGLKAEMEALKAASMAKQKQYVAIAEMRRTTFEPIYQLATLLPKAPLAAPLPDGGAVVALALSELAVSHLRCEAEQLNMEWPAFLQQHLQDAIENRGAAF